MVLEGAGDPLPGQNPGRVGLSKNSRFVRGRKQPDPVANTLFVFFGQFVDHDLTNSIVRQVTK